MFGLFRKRVEDTVAFKAYREEALDTLADILTRWSFPMCFVSSWIKTGDIEGHIKNNYSIGCSAESLAVRTFHQMVADVNAHDIEVPPIQAQFRPDRAAMLKEMGV
jgi:hypothetical protein